MLGREDVVCGFLSPEGKFYKCEYYGHMDLADKLVKEFNLVGDGFWVLPEDILLANGWISIRVRDSYKAVYDKDGKIIWITDAQMDFFASNKDLFTFAQLADIEDMVRDFGELRRLHEKDKELMGLAQTKYQGPQEEANA